MPSLPVIFDVGGLSSPTVLNSKNQKQHQIQIKFLMFAPYVLMSGIASLKQDYRFGVFLAVILLKYTNWNSHPHNQPEQEGQILDSDGLWICESFAKRCVWVICFRDKFYIFCYFILFYHKFLSAPPWPKLYIQSVWLQITKNCLQKVRLADHKGKNLSIALRGLRFRKIRNRSQ